jgi:hypothetical protein
MPHRYCPGCGAAATSDARFCAACGEALGGPAQAPPPAPAPAPRRLDEPEIEVYAFRPLYVRTLVEFLICVLTLGLAWAFLAASRLGIRYRVTTQRIEVREGVVTHVSRFIDLFRIEDFEVEEPFFLRLRGAGNLILHSMDKDQPVAVLHAIPGVRAVYEKVRILTREERARRGVRVIEGL